MKRLPVLLLLILFAWGTVGAATAGAPDDDIILDDFMLTETVVGQAARNDEFRQLTIWVVAILAGLGLIAGVWKLSHDAAASRPVVRPKRPWEL
jgi:hypothetical protein